MSGARVVLDGSMGEGGGQVLRSALSLAMVTGRELTIENIRAGRTKPGLRPQHVQCVHAAARVSHGACQGAEVGSRSVTFCPGDVSHGSYTFEIGTAGSTSRSSAIRSSLIFGQPPDVGETGPR